MADLNWSDAQWQKVKDAVTEAFGRASIAGAFLPMYGPLPGSAEIVRNERLAQTAGTPPTLRLDADHPDVNVKLVNVTVNVSLSSEQVADDTLSNALFAFRRAANILAQEEDRVVFEGFGQSPRGQDSVYVVNNPPPQRGLADLFGRRRFTSFEPPQAGTRLGPLVLAAIVRAINTLEENLNPAPFACVLGNTLFQAVYEPTGSLVLPSDRITPLLKGGPLLRSGRMIDTAGIVVSLAGNAVDVVLGTPPTVQFLQRTDAARFLFRVYERFALRIRDTVRPPVAGFRVRPTAVDRAVERRQRALVNAERDAARGLQDNESVL